MSVKLTTSLSQRLVLTPQLRQRIEMLQMTSLELSELIQQQMLENPVLEEVQTQDEQREIEKEILDQLAGGPDDAAQVEAAAPESMNGNLASANGAGEAQAVEPAAAPEAFEGDEAARAEEFGEHVDEFGDEHESSEQSGDAFEEIDFGREFQDYLDPGYKTQEFEYKEDAPTFEQFLSRAPSLAEHLEWQLHMTQIGDELVPVCEGVIGNLDGDGRLNATNEEIAELGGWPAELVEEARRVVLRLDPIGCGARDARECLLVQLEFHGHEECPRGAENCMAARLISEHPLAELQQHKLPNLAKQIGVVVRELV